MALPNGWVSDVDPKGRTFYVNTLTGISQWEYPLAPASEISVPEKPSVPPSYDSALASGPTDAEMVDFHTANPVVSSPNGYSPHDYSSVNNGYGATPYNENPDYNAGYNTNPSPTAVYGRSSNSHSPYDSGPIIHASFNSGPNNSGYYPNQPGQSTDNLPYKRTAFPYPSSINMPTLQTVPFSSPDFDIMHAAQPPHFVDHQKGCCETCCEITCNNKLVIFTSVIVFLLLCGTVAVWVAASGTEAVIPVTIVTGQLYFMYFITTFCPILWACKGHRSGFCTNDDVVEEYVTEAVPYESVKQHLENLYRGEPALAIEISASHRTGGKNKRTIRTYHSFVFLSIAEYRTLNPDVDSTINAMLNSRYNTNIVKVKNTYTLTDVQKKWLDDIVEIEIERNKHRDRTVTVRPAFFIGGEKVEIVKTRKTDCSFRDAIGCIGLNWISRMLCSLLPLFCFYMCCYRCTERPFSVENNKFLVLNTNAAGINVEVDKYHPYKIFGDLLPSYNSYTPMKSS